MKGRNHSYDRLLLLAGALLLPACVPHPEPPSAGRITHVVVVTETPAGERTQYVDATVVDAVLLGHQARQRFYAGTGSEQVEEWRNFLTHLPPAAPTDRVDCFHCQTSACACACIGEDYVGTVRRVGLLIDGGGPEARLWWVLPEWRGAILLTDAARAQYSGGANAAENSVPAGTTVLLDWDRAVPTAQRITAHPM